MDILSVAMELTEVVSRLVERVRQLYWAVVLIGHRCPDCTGALTMVGESRCQCPSCGRTFDPTVAFQRCLDCGGPLALRIRRYQCQRCGADVPSCFVFEGVAFDREYFARQMAESRQRKRRRQEQLRRLVAENRSETIDPAPIDLEAIPGLVEALNGLSVGPEIRVLLPLCKGFDLRRYQRHVEAHVGPIEVYFDRIPPLEKDARMDRIWRFVAIIFMAHAGLVQICQHEETILVSQIVAN